MGNLKYKGPFVSYSLLTKFYRLQNKNENNIILKTWSRSSTILPLFLGSTIVLTSGKIFSSIFIYDAIIGYKLGEFVNTRYFCMHKEVDPELQRLSQKNKPLIKKFDEEGNKLKRRNYKKDYLEKRLSKRSRIYDEGDEE